MMLSWLKGLLANRRSRLLATAAGVAVGVALIASIGAFLSSTVSKMTERAAARVAVDWQVQGTPGASPSKLLAKVKADSQVRAALPVSFAGTPRLSATTGGSTQVTGAGRVLGLPAGYRAAFPGQLRTLSGSDSGVLLAQQTAANLHARPGVTVQIARTGLSPVRVRVAGVVDLPLADSLFQQVGAPAGAQAQAPPDNVILLPAATFARIEGSPASPLGGPVVTQVHAALSRTLPASPSAAFDQVSGQARNLETRLAGTGLVGDNLGSALDQARGDALYAELLFLFLGLPGAIIAGLLTASIASAGAERRRRDAALLRARGASTGALVRVALSETLLAAGTGIAAGLGVAVVIGLTTFGTASFGAGGQTAGVWAAVAAFTGMAIAAGSIALPAWRDARGLTVA